VAQTLLDVKRRLNVAMILIGHDMGLQAQLVDRIAVMYAGNIAEIAPVKAAFAKPRHPYTRLLISAIPSIKERKPLQVTEGLTHDLRNPPPGCVYNPRCPLADDECHTVVPQLREIAPDHQVACHHAEWSI
jgi:peptide/nickel transport system ATP-binding protein